MGKQTPYSGWLVEDISIFVLQVVIIGNTQPPSLCPQRLTLPTSGICGRSFSQPQYPLADAIDLCLRNVRCYLLQQYFQIFVDYSIKHFVILPHGNFCLFIHRLPNPMRLYVAQLTGWCFYARWPIGRWPGLTDLLYQSPDSVSPCGWAVPIPSFSLANPARCL